MKSFYRFSHIKLNMFLTVLALREALSDGFTFKRAGRIRGLSQHLAVVNWLLRKKL